MWLLTVFVDDADGSSWSFLSLPLHQLAAAAARGLRAPHYRGKHMTPRFDPELRFIDYPSYRKAASLLCRRLLCSSFLSILSIINAKEPNTNANALQDHTSSNHYRRFSISSSRAPSLHRDHHSRRSNGRRTQTTRPPDLPRSLATRPPCQLLQSGEGRVLLYDFRVQRQVQLSIRDGEQPC